MRLFASILLGLGILLGQAEAPVLIYGKEVPAAQVPKEVARLFAESYLRENGLGLSTEELERTQAKFAKNVNRSSQTDWFARLIAENFKVQRYLFQKHGGRVALSAFGTHVAKDALVAEMKLAEAKGKLVFRDAGTRAAVYKQILEMRGDGEVQGQKAKEAFQHAPWD